MKISTDRQEFFSGIHALTALESVPGTGFDFYLTTPANGIYAVHERRFLVEAIAERGDRLPLRLVLNWPSLAEE
jgi:hypothetical protein